MPGNSHTTASRNSGPATVHVNYALPRKGIPAAASFRRWVAATLEGAGRSSPAELSIRIVDRAEGQELNRRYRHRNKATNVLSFPAELPDGIALPLLGDLVICAPVVAREAADQGKAPRNHWAHMTVHGTLHLLGFDHVLTEDADIMEALETRILAGMGIADPYKSSD
ncbi:MAG: rRNA maturation RNase YbeY [Rhodanobacteraceae bacterium]